MVCMSDSLQPDAGSEPLALPRCFPKSGAQRSGGIEKTITNLLVLSLSRDGEIYSNE